MTRPSDADGLLESSLSDAGSETFGVVSSVSILTGGTCAVSGKGDGGADFAVA